MVAVLPKTADQVAPSCALPAGSSRAARRRHLAVRRRAAARRWHPAGLARFNRILEIDYENRVAWSSPASPISPFPRRWPRPASITRPILVQIACTIGGNVAENSGGVHCLKYGLTTNNVLGCELVLMTGEIVRLGGKQLDAGGWICWPRRRLGRVARRRHRSHGTDPEEAAHRARGASLRLPKPGQCVAAIIGAGIIPAASK